MAETRAFSVRETRAIDDSGTKRIAGLTAPYNSETVIGDWFREVIRPGAFTKTLRENPNIVALWSHDAGKPLARKSTGTLRLDDGADGIGYEIDLGAQTWADDAYESVRRGDVQGASFGFDVVKERWEFSSEPGTLDLREILEAKLYEISPVTFPAYEQTSAEARSIRDAARAKYAPKPDLPTRASEPGKGTQEPPAANHSLGSEPDARHSEAEREEHALRMQLLEIN